jgi:hypothetical protein
LPSSSMRDAALVRRAVAVRFARTRARETCRLAKRNLMRAQ